MSASEPEEVEQLRLADAPSIQITSPGSARVAHGDYIEVNIHLNEPGDGAERLAASIREIVGGAVEGVYSARK